MEDKAREWGRYAELRPDQLAEIVGKTPVAYWPLGLLEHHGWHLPIGLDGLKAERICTRIAEQTGGVVLPTMWWGAGGGHGDFLWTHYQSPDAAAAIVGRTVEQLIAFGLRAIALMAGHYPWTAILDRRLAPLQQAHPEVLLIWGTEMDIAGDVRLPGDHAAREETSYGLALLPQWVELDALRPGRDRSSSWPQGQAPAEETRHPGVCFDPASAHFAQMGKDARTGSAERGEAAVSGLVQSLARQINAFLSSTPSAPASVHHRGNGGNE